MEEYPRTVMDFERSFSSEEACREYLFRLRRPEGFRCPRCGNGKAWTTGRTLYHCARCDYETSLTAGTIFQDTGKPLLLWFRAMWYVSNQKQGVSALGLQRALGLGSYHTAWTWLHKLRHAMVRPGRDQLSGIVEVDETYIGGEKSGKRGRGAAGKTPVVVAVEDHNGHLGRIRLRRVQDASAKSLMPAVHEVVALGSTVRTDGWPGYSDLMSLGYTHSVVRRSAESDENLLPLVNRVVFLLKRRLLGTHQGAVRPSHLDYYLDEFTFRFNRRTSGSRGKLFYLLAQQAVAIGPVRVQDI